MRMRRKKNLEQRLDDCRDLVTNLQVEDRHFGSGGDTACRIELTRLFGNDRPVELEIGCGKGGFLCEIAARHPKVNFLAVEKFGNVIVTACEAVQERGLSNVRFFWGDAEYLPRFLPTHSVRRVYLNFSTPFPKKHYAVHRLTHPHFQEMYKGLLTSGGEIQQKTDDRNFFEYSLEQFSAAGYRLRNISLDLHHSDCPDNIVTEYEQRFADQGLPIYRLEATVPEENA